MARKTRVQVIVPMDGTSKANDAALPVRTWSWVTLARALFMDITAIPLLQL